MKDGAEAEWASLLEEYKKPAFGYELVHQDAAQGALKQHVFLVRRKRIHPMAYASVFANTVKWSAVLFKYTVVRLKCRMIVIARVWNYGPMQLYCFQRSGFSQHP